VQPLTSGLPAKRRIQSESLALVLLLTALYALVGRGIFFSSDEGHSYNTALSLLHGSLDIGPGENVHEGRDGYFYPSREILPAVVTIPFTLLGTGAQILAHGAAAPRAPGARYPTDWPSFVTLTLLGPLTTAFTLLLLHGFVRREGVGRADALLLTLAAGWATPLAVYAKTLFPQVFEAAWLMLALASAAEWRRTGSPRAAKWLGLACGLGLMTRAAFALASVWFFGYLLLAGSMKWRERLRALVPFLILAGCGAAVTALVNWVRWGSPLDFGHHRADEAFDYPPLQGLYGLLLSPGKSIFLYSPILLLVCAYAGILWQRGRAEVVLVLGITLSYLALYCRWYDWMGGLAWGPRFLVPLIPVWIALLGRTLVEPEARGARGLIASMALIGFGVQWLGLTVYPYHTRWTDPFAWSESFLEEHVRILWQGGPDDLWLWSSARGTRPYTVLVVLFALVAFWAACVLWRRAERRERLTLAILVGATALILIGGALSVVSRNDKPHGQALHLLRDLGELQVMQVPIQRIAGQQLAVDADGFDAALVQEQHLVAGADRRNAMGQEEDGAAGQDAEHGIVEL
jgi:hypothetical protein